MRSPGLSDAGAVPESSSGRPEDLLHRLLAGTARPSLYVTTTAVDIRRARPVLLTQVIQNPPEGLRFLRTEVVKAAKQKGEPVDAAGLAPRVANWANWQSSPTGLTFHFGEYQLGGAGIRSYTVPWPRARLVLSAYGEKLLRAGNRRPDANLT